MHCICGGGVWRWQCSMRFSCPSDQCSQGSPPLASTWSTVETTLIIMHRIHYAESKCTNNWCWRARAGTYSSWRWQWSRASTHLHMASTYRSVTNQQLLSASIPWSDPTVRSRTVPKQVRVQSTKYMVNNEKCAHIRNIGNITVFPSTSTVLALVWHCSALLCR